MSRYENYSEASKYFDKTRVPVGGEILIGVLALSRQSRSEFRLLDAGCGTGAYSEIVLPHVDHIDAIDINPDMLAVYSVPAVSSSSIVRAMSSFATVTGTFTSFRRRSKPFITVASRLLNWRRC